MKFEAGTFARVRRLLLSPAALVLALFAALAGAGLATGIMAYHALDHGTNYTTLSWALIAPTWSLLVLLWLLARRWPLPAAVPMALLAAFTGIYYSDVYGQYPAGFLYLLAMAAIFLPDAAKNEPVQTSEALPASERTAG